MADSSLDHRGSSVPTFSIQRYVYGSTLIGIFSSALIIRQVGFDLQVFDLIMLLNLLLMTLIGPISVPKRFCWALGYLLCSGLLGVLNGTDTPFLFVKQFVGISVSALYFYNFFKSEGFSVERVFSDYARVAYWLSLIGLFEFVIVCAVQHQFVRLQSVLSEPAYYCVVVLPAYYWYAYMYVTRKKNRREFLIISCAMVLAGSSLGFIGIAFGILLLFSRRRYLTLVAPIIVGALLLFTYLVSSDFRLRIDDTFSAAKASDVSGTNLSTYALISNMIVMEHVLQEHPILGNGLGSHYLSHERFIGYVPGYELYEAMAADDLNAKDAASLAIRSLSELGVLGFAIILWFVVKFHVRGTDDHAAISNAILICFFMKLLRGGHLFPPEQFFFVVAYILNYQSHMSEQHLLASEAGVAA